MINIQRLRSARPGDTREELCRSQATAGARSAMSSTSLQPADCSISRSRSATPPSGRSGVRRREKGRHRTVYAEPGDLPDGCRCRADRRRSRSRPPRLSLERCRIIGPALVEGERALEGAVRPCPTGPRPRCGDRRVKRRRGARLGEGIVPDILVPQLRRADYKIVRGCARLTARHLNQSGAVKDDLLRATIDTDRLSATPPSLRRRGSFQLIKQSELSGSHRAETWQQAARSMWHAARTISRRSAASWLERRWPRLRRRGAGRIYRNSSVRDVLVAALSARRGNPPRHCRAGLAIAPSRSAC